MGRRGGPLLIYFGKKSNLSVKQIRSRSGTTFCLAWSGSKLLAQIQQQMITITAIDDSDNV